MFASTGVREAPDAIGMTALGGTSSGRCGEDSRWAGAPGPHSVVRMTRGATTTMREASRARPARGVVRVLTCSALCSVGLVTVLLTTAARTDTALGALGTAPGC